MALELYRIDDRLIHGQVVVGWGQPLDLGFIVLVDDEVASSDWEQELYRMGVPPDMDVYFDGVEAAATNLERYQDDDRRGLLLTGDIDTMTRLVDSTDAVMCQRIVDGLELTDVPPVDWAFYHAGGVYFVPTARTDTSGITTRWHPFVILDSSMVILDVWSM